MIYADNAKNNMLDSLAGVVDSVSLHTGFSRSGANEVSGGSYARQSVSWNAASGGSAAASNQPAPDVPSSTTVQYVGLYNSTGPTFHGMSPLGNTTSFNAYLDQTNNEVHADNHGLSAGERVGFFADSLPTALTEGQLYYVINPTTDAFQIATSAGGAAVTWASDDQALAADATPETFSNSGTLTLTSLSLGLNFLT